MFRFRLPALSLMAAVLLSAAPAVAQHSAKTNTKPVKAQVGGPVIQESLSGLDLIPYRSTGTFGMRINHRLTQPATVRLTDTKTSRFIVNELLEPSPAPTRALQVGKLANGEYKMEVIMSDTTYWKTVRVSR